MPLLVLSHLGLQSEFCFGRLAGSWNACNRHLYAFTHFTQEHTYSQSLFFQLPVHVSLELRVENQTG